MAEKKKMRFSIRNQIMLGSIFVNLLIIATTSIVIYKQVSNRLMEAASRDALSLVKVASSEINGNLLGLIDLDSEESYAYSVIRQSLEEIDEHVNAEGVYIIAERENQYYNLVSQDGSSIREIAIGDEKAIQATFSEGSFANDQSMNSVNAAMADVSYAVEESANGINKVAEAVGNMTTHMQVNQDIVNDNTEIAKRLNMEVNKFKYQ